MILVNKHAARAQLSVASNNFPMRGYDYTNLMDAYDKSAFDHSYLLCRKLDSAQSVEFICRDHVVYAKTVDTMGFSDETLVHHLNSSLHSDLKVKKPSRVKLFFHGVLSFIVDCIRDYD